MDLALEIRKSNVDEETALQLMDHFAAFEKQANEWKDKADMIIVKNESETDLMDQARKARLSLKEIRIAVDKKHKELKEESLKKGQMLDLIKRTLIGYISPIEKHLQSQEDFKKIKEAEAKEKLQAERLELITPYMGEDAKNIPFGDMDKDAFDNLLKGQKMAYDQKIKDERKREREEKKEAERKAEDERKIKVENERVRKLSELGFTWNADEEIYELPFDDSVFLPVECIRSDSDELFNSFIDNTKKIVEEENKRLAKEKAKLEKIEQEKRDNANAQRRLKRAPDKEKLLSFAAQIESIECTPMKDEEAQKILNGATELLTKVVNYVRTNAEKL